MRSSDAIAPRRRPSPWAWLVTGSAVVVVGCGLVLGAWWLWTAVGVVVVGAGITVALIAMDEDPKPVHGDTDPPVVRGRVALVELP